MTGDQMLGLRERKKADTRRALSDAALELAFEHGFDAVTREAIANLAGVSLRTFNNYFTGKYEALAFRLTERMRRSIAAFRDASGRRTAVDVVTEAVVGRSRGGHARARRAPMHVPDRRELAEIRKLLMMPEIRTAVPRDSARRLGAGDRGEDGHRPGARHVSAAGDRRRPRRRRHRDGGLRASEPPVAITDLLRSGLAAVAAGLPEPDRRSNHA